MKLQEFLISETANEDRALISLSTAIARHLRQYEGSDFDPDVDLDSDDPYNDDEVLNLDMYTQEDEPVDVGTIGKLFDTPLTLLNPIKLQIQSDYGMRHRLKTDKEAEVIKKPGEEDALGLWYGYPDAILVLNSDYLGTDQLRTVITHELRHALDDFKSGFRAGTSKRYSTSINKAHRKSAQDYFIGSDAYYAQPDEINARFSQVLHNLVYWIDHAFKKVEPEKIKSFVYDKFKALLDYHRISEVFPEKEKSRGYKRLMKRGLDFMQKEIDYKGKIYNKQASGKF